MVVCHSARSLVDLAIEALHQNQAVKVHCGPANLQHKCNVKISINPNRATGGNFAQLWILIHLKTKLDESHVVAHSHDHTSGKTVITLNFWCRGGSHGSTGGDDDDRKPERDDNRKSDDDVDDDNGDGNDWPACADGNCNLEGNSNQEGGGTSSADTHNNHDGSLAKKPRVNATMLPESFIMNESDETVSNANTTAQLFNIADDEEDRESWGSIVAGSDSSDMMVKSGPSPDTYVFVLMETLNKIEQCNLSVCDMLGEWVTVEKDRPQQHGGQGNALTPLSPMPPCKFSQVDVDDQPFVGCGTLYEFSFDELFEHWGEHAKKVSAAFVSEAMESTADGLCDDKCADIFENGEAMAAFCVQLACHESPILEKVLYMNQLMEDIRNCAASDPVKFSEWQLEMQVTLSSICADGSECESVRSEIDQTGNQELRVQR